MNNVNNLFKFFGWQGGTIHQISEETGVSVYNLIYGEFDNESIGLNDYLSGHKSMDQNQGYRNNIAKQWEGNIDFWLGVRDYKG